MLQHTAWSPRPDLSRCPPLLQVKRDTEVPPKYARAQLALRTTADPIAAAVCAYRATGGRATVRATAMSPRGTSYTAAASQTTTSGIRAPAAVNAGLHIVHARAARQRQARTPSATVVETKCIASVFGEPICLTALHAVVYAPLRAVLLCRIYDPAILNRS